MSRWLLPCVCLTPLLFSQPDGCYAEEDCIPCCQLCERTSAFGAGGGFVYLHPSTGAVDYARSVEIAPFPNQVGQSIESRHLCVETEHSPGFELFAFFQGPSDCCSDFAWELRAHFLSHCMDHKVSKTASSPAFFQPLMGWVPSLGTDAFLAASARVETSLEMVSGEIGGICSRGALLRYFVGVQYLHLKQRLDVFYSKPFPIQTQTRDTTTNAIECGRFRGVGPRMGIDGTLPLLCGLSLFGDLAFNLLVSNKATTFDQKTEVAPGDSVIFRNTIRLCERLCTDCALTPGIEAQAGLGLDVDLWGCFMLGLRGGYRSLYYWDALSHLNVITTRLFPVIPSTTTVYQDSAAVEEGLNFGLTGWFVSATLTF